MIRKLSIAKVKDIGDAASLYSLTFRASLSNAAANAGTKSNSERIFAPYTVFKGKAALSVSPVLPSFVKTDYGGLKLDRRGVMMMTFWPAVGVRKYDWEKRLLFALSATEIGSLISLGSGDPCEFFHDPSMQTSNAGQVRKSLSFKPHADGSGYIVSLNVNNSIQKTNESLMVPVTKAEFAVMRTAFSFALPRLMGWDHYADPVPGSATKNLSNSSRGGLQLLDLEWDK